MAMFGVGPNGLPVQDDGGGQVDTTSPCPEGKQRDAKGMCVEASQAVQATNTGVAGPNPTAAPSTPPPPGYNPEEFRQRWLKSGIKDNSLIPKFLQDNADVSQGITHNGKDKITYPSQYHKYSTVDLIGNANDADPGNNSNIFLAGSMANKPKPKSPPGGGIPPMGGNGFVDSGHGGDIGPDGKLKDKGGKSGGSGGSGGGGAAGGNLYTPSNPLKAFNFTYNPFKPTHELKQFNYSPYQDFKGPDAEEFKFSEIGKYEGEKMPVYDPAKSDLSYDPLQAGNAQFQGDDAQRAKASGLIDKFLGETSMNPAVVAQMKEGQKGSILSMAQQAKQGAAQDAARRGVAPRGVSGIDSKAIGDISKSYRDIDIAKAVQDRTDERDAVGMASAFRKGNLDEFLAGEALGMDRNRFNADERFRGYGAARDTENFNADQGFRGYQSRADANREDFDRFFGMEGMRRDQDRDRVGEAARVQNTNFDRHISQEDRRFGREGAQAGENARVQDSDFQRWLGQEGMNINVQGANASEQARVQGQEFQQWATRQGFDLDRARMAQDESQFARNLQLLIARFLAEK